MICDKQFRLKKDGTCYKNSFCKNPELVENYDLAMADKNRTWICHHRKEEFYASQELIYLGMYYNVPPEDLVFVRDPKEHYSWPHKGREEENRKISITMKGHEVSSETKRKLSESCSSKVKVRCAETDQIFDSIKAATIACRLKSINSIRYALKNSNHTAGGYHWSYV